MFLIHSMALALFRLIASLGRKMVIANTGGSFALLVIFLLGGFILSKRKHSAASARLYSMLTLQNMSRQTHLGKRKRCR